MNEHFWLKNGSVPIKETKSNTADKVILAEREIKWLQSSTDNKMQTS